MIETAIRQAQQEAAVTCELCRAPGRLVDTNGYHWVACPMHSSARLYGNLEPIVPHTWELEEVDGGSVGIGVFYVCNACGASGGPAMGPNLSKSMSLYPPFHAGDGLDCIISLDCNVAKKQIEELTRVT